MANRIVKVKEDVLRNPKNILVTIQVLMLQGKPIFDAYQDFCEILGDDVMEYNDFDFWWYRFLNGEFDLDYDRSKEKKKRELGDMPPLIVEKIIKNLDAGDRYPLLEVSKGIRNIMVDSNLLISELSMKFKDDLISLQFNRRCAEFVRGRQTKVISGGVKKFVKGGHIDVAMKTLAHILKNPKLQFSDFDINFYECRRTEHDELMKYSKAVKNVLQSTPHQIHVERLKMTFVEDTQLMDIIPYLKPGVLLVMGIYSGNASEAGIKPLMELEQFKQAQAFWMRGCIFPAAFEKLAHFSDINIQTGYLTEKEFIRIKNILLASPHFEYCSLYEVNVEDPNLLKKFNKKKIPIPGSEDSVRILVDFYRITIKRISNK